MEITGGGGVVAAFTYRVKNVLKNVLVKTDMIGMFKRVEVITDDRHEKRLTLGELFKLNGENGPLAGIATKIQVWSTQLPWVHLGKNGKICKNWRRSKFNSHKNCKSSIWPR